MRLLTFSFLRSFQKKLLNINVMRTLSNCDKTKPPLNSYERYIEAGEFIELEASWPEKDEGMLELLQHEMQVFPDFVLEKEEQLLMDEVEPYLKKMRYEFDHWDDAIHGFKETEWPTVRWQEHNAEVFKRVAKTAFSYPGSGKPLPYQHVLDLAGGGQIKPHVDSVRYCGEVIAGLSLLSAAVMLFSHTLRPELSFRALLPRRSLYVMRGTVRYLFKHAVCGGVSTAATCRDVHVPVATVRSSHVPLAEAFRDAHVPRRRRVAIITRSAPKPYDPRPPSTQADTDTN